VYNSITSSKKAQMISMGLLSTNYSHNFSSSLLCVSQCVMYRHSNEPFLNIGWMG